MRKIALLAMTVSLGSCSAALDGDGFRPASQPPSASRARQAARPPTPRPAPGSTPAPPPASVVAPLAAVVSSPSTDRATSILAYHNDLEACRAVASAGLGSPAALDDVAALKRSLAGGTADGTGQGVVSVSHQSDDLALRRDRAVKTCLSKRGYVLKD